MSIDLRKYCNYVISCVSIEIINYNNYEISIVSIIDTIMLTSIGKL